LNNRVFITPNYLLIDTDVLIDENISEPYLNIKFLDCDNATAFHLLKMKRVKIKNCQTHPIKNTIHINKKDLDDYYGFLNIK